MYSNDYYKVVEATEENIMKDFINNLKGLAFKLKDLEDISQLDENKIHEILYNHRVGNIHDFKEKDMMEAIYNYQYRIDKSEFDRSILDLLYRADKNNILKLYLVYPFLTEAFIRYGRENVNILAMKIKEHDENN